jgi:hypothetical protein
MSLHHVVMRGLGVIALAVAPAAAVVATAGPAAAAVLTVDDVADGAPVAADCTDATPGNCSVRDAFAAAIGPSDTIQLAAGVTYDLTYCPGTANGSVQYVTGGALTLEGNGATIRQTCGAGPSNGEIQVANAATLTVNNVTLTGANATDNVGAIQAGNDNVVIIVRNSSLVGNKGGAGAGISTAGTVTIENSTIANNTATGPNGGGAIRAIDNTVTVTNSTITGNTANSGVGGGGIRTNTASGPSGNVVLTYSTVVGNSSSLPTGDNISLTGGNLQSFGSVVGLPGDGTGPSCVIGGGTTASQGYNFEDASTCGFGSGPGDVVNGGNPDLGALASNGGPTQTRLPGAPLIDKIPAASPCGGVNITVDQRGLPRPTTTGTFCDIGAVEVQRVVTALALAPDFTG